MTASGSYDLATLLEDLRASEIAGELSWLYDGAWTVSLGTPCRAEATFISLDEAAEWLRNKALALYPDSLFAETHRHLQKEAPAD